MVCVHRLRAGTTKKIEFSFDSSEDTAECIASEMMEDLSLSAQEARLIAAKIEEELTRCAPRHHGHNEVQHQRPLPV